MAGDPWGIAVSSGYLLVVAVPSVLVVGLCARYTVNRRARPEPEPSRKARYRRWLLIAISAVLVALAVPTLPAVWWTWDHVPGEMNNTDHIAAGVPGVSPDVLTVSRCHRGMLLIAWHCTGRTSSGSAWVADDFRPVHAGTTIDINTVPRSAAVCRWGERFLGEMFLYTLGLAASWSALVLACARRPPVATVVLLSAAALLVLPMLIPAVL